MKSMLARIKRTVRIILIAVLLFSVILTNLAPVFTSVYAIPDIKNELIIPVLDPDIIDTITDIDIDTDVDNDIDTVPDEIMPAVHEHDVHCTYSYRIEDGNVIQKCDVCDEDINIVSVSFDDSLGYTEVGGVRYWNVDELAEYVQNGHKRGPFITSITPVIDNSASGLIRTYLSYKKGNQYFFNEMPTQDGEYQLFLYVDAASTRGAVNNTFIAKSLNYVISSEDMANVYIITEHTADYIHAECSATGKEMSAQLVLNYDNIEQKSFIGTNDHISQLIYIDDSNWDYSVKCINSLGIMYFNTKYGYNVDPDKVFATEGTYNVKLVAYYGDNGEYYSSSESETITIKTHNHSGFGSHTYCVENNKIIQKCAVCGESLNACEIIIDDSINYSIRNGVPSFNKAVITEYVQNGHQMGPFSVKVTPLAENDAADLIASSYFGSTIKFRKTIRYIDQEQPWTGLQTTYEGYENEMPTEPGDYNITLTISGYDSRNGTQTTYKCETCYYSIYSGVDINDLEIVIDESLGSEVSSGGKLTWDVGSIKNLNKNGISPMTIRIPDDVADLLSDTYVRLLYVDGNGGKSFVFPNTAGDYTAYIAFFDDLSDISSETLRSEGLPFRISSVCRRHDATHDYGYMISEGRLVQYCADCGKPVRSYELNVDDSLIREYTSNSTLTWSINEISNYGSNSSPFDISGDVLLSNATIKSEPIVSIVYETKLSDNSTFSFKLPTGKGTYTAYAAVLQNKSDANSIIFRGPSIDFEIKGAMNNEYADYKVLSKTLLQKQQGRLENGGYQYSLPGGKYILQEDLDLPGTIEIMYGGTEIYLNGHTIYSTIRVFADTKIIDNAECLGRIIQSNGGFAEKIASVVYVYKATLTLENLNICNSNCSGIYAKEATVTINNCNISNNSGRRYAGGIGIESSYVKLNNSTVQYCYGTNTSTWTYASISMIKNSTLILNNTSVHKCNEIGLTRGIDMADGSQTLVLSGTSKISGNDVGVSAGKNNNIYLSGETQITGNKNGGLVIRQAGTEGTKLYFAETDDNIDIEISFEECADKPADSYVAFISSEKSREFITKSFRRTDGGKVALNFGQSGTITFGNDYLLEENVIKTQCSSCNNEGTVTFNMASYNNEVDRGYTIGTDFSKIFTMEKSGWDDEHILAYPTIVYGYMNPETGIIDSYSLKAPQKAGVYTVKMSLLFTKDVISSEYISTKETYFAIVSDSKCDHEDYRYYCEYNNITLRCSECVRILGEARINGNNCSLSSLPVEDGRYMLYECQGDELLVDYGDNEDLFDEISLVYGYYQDDGSIEYSLKAPKESCKFTVHTALLEDDNDPDSAIIKNEDILCEFLYHGWEYNATERDISARCIMCSEEASVHLESSGADYASRHYDNSSKEEHFDYDIFYQENWVGQKGIEQFYVLYNGIAVNDEFNSTFKNNVFYKPTISGNYTARIVLLSDINNPESAYLTTGEMPYYLAGVLMGNPYLKIVDYSENQYQLLEAPAIIDNAYQVGTFEELMWVAKYVKDSKNINITNDIVFNPITVINNGESIRCGSNIIYNWPGIGNSNTCEYYGCIYGNGHTIYGLYSKGNDYAGLILDGRNNAVKDLTISDAIFSADINAGGIVAVETSDTDGSFTASPSFTNCRVENSLINQEKDDDVFTMGVGGLIGRYREMGGKSVLTLYNCVVNSRITGHCAGGLIGSIDDSFNWKYGSDVWVVILDCINLGYVFSDYYAGGFIGKTGNSGEEFFYINQCVNLGEIEGNQSFCGGFIGWLRWLKRDNSFFTNNVNVGKVHNFSDTKCGAFFGTVTDAKFGFVENNQYSGCKKTVGYIWYDNKEDGYVFEATALSSSDTVEKSVCCDGEHCICDNHWTWIKFADCEHDGKLAKLCLVCGRAVESKTVKAHGHNYVFGKCVYCLENDPDGYSLASVFSEFGVGLYAMSAAIVASVGYVFIYKKRKFKKQ